MKSTKRRAPSPEAFVSGNSVLRAMTSALLFEALPPGCDIPPAYGESKPMREARSRVVCFSIRVRTGETW